MHFNDLNNDVLQLIFDLLPQRDIKTLRLVNKALKSRVTLSITRLFLSPNRTNIDVFKAVLGHANFREQVQEIVWDDARLERYDDHTRTPLQMEFEQRDSPAKTSTEFASDIKDQEAFVQSVLDLRRKELWGDAEWLSIEDSLRLYRALYDEQEAIINRQEDVAMLRRGLLELPNLKRVTLTSEAWRPYPLFPLYETPFFRSLKPGMKMPLPWPWLGEDDLPLVRFEERNDRLSEPWDVSQEHWRGYNIVVSELLATASHHNVTEVIIDVHREKTGVSQQLFMEESAGLSATVEMFKTVQLTRLDLALNMEILSQMMDGDAWAFGNQPYLKRALSCLTNLTHFHLHLTSVEDYINFQHLDTVPWMDLQRVLPTPYSEAWPQLRHLGLANIVTTEEGLYSLLSSLPALTDIDLDSMVLRVDETTVAFGLLKSLLDRVKTSLTATFPATDITTSWRGRKTAPRWTIRCHFSDQPDRITYYPDAIHGFLYGNNSNPFLPENWDAAWSVEDFHEDAKVCNGAKWENRDERERTKFMNLLLYPPPMGAR